MNALRRHKFSDFVSCFKMSYVGGDVCICRRYCSNFFLGKPYLFLARNFLQTNYQTSQSQNKTFYTKHHVSHCKTTTQLMRTTTRVACRFSFATTSLSSPGVVSSSILVVVLDVNISKLFLKSTKPFFFLLLSFIYT